MLRRWGSASALVALIVLIAACGGPGTPESSFDASTPFVAEDGATIGASDDGFSSAATLRSHVLAGPSVPLPASVEQVGAVRRISADETLAASPSAPFVLGLPLPGGEDPQQLAIAVLESSRGEFDIGAEPPAEGGSASWVFLDAVYDAGSDRLFAAILGITEGGWEAVLVRSSRFETGVTGAAGLRSQQEPGFQATCSPLFDDPSATETCGAAERTAAAGHLSDVNADLTSLGFTDRPRLSRTPDQVELTIISQNPFQYEVTVILGDYTMELRPTSQVLPGTGGMYSSGTGNFWVAIGTNGVTAGTRETIRHEYFHATQYGYDPSFATTASWLASRWSIEGQAVLSESSVPTLGRDTGRLLRDVDETLFRSMWTGNAWGPRPDSEYRAQDFWAYLGARAGADLSFLVAFAEEGQRSDQVDAVLERDYASDYPDGLEDAYWDWVRNQAFEKQVDIGGGVLGASCDFQTAVATPIDVVADASGSTATPFNLTPFTTEVVRFEITNDAAIALDFELNVPRSSSELRIKFFDPADAGSDACWSDPELSQETVRVPAGTTVERYALVANVDYLLSQAVVASATPQAELTIVLPDGPFQELESLDFRADLVGVADPSSIDIAWTVTDGDDATVPLDFGGTSVSGQTVTSEVPCDDLLVRADATVPGVGTVFDVTAVSCLPPTQTFVFSADRARSGEVTSTPAAFDGSSLTDIRIGDDASNVGLHGLLHFGLGTLPDGLVAIESATLTLGFENPVGTPADLDTELVVVHVDYGTTLDADDYRAVPPFPTLFPSLYRIPFTETGFGSTDLDVTQAVQDAWADRATYGDHVQLMPYLAQGTDGDSVEDHLVLNFEDAPGTTLTPSLSITFRNY